MALMQISDRFRSEMRAETSPIPRNAKLTMSVSSMYRAIASGGSTVATGTRVSRTTDSEWVLELGERHLLRPRELPRHRPERAEKRVGPFVDRLQDDATTFTPNRDLDFAFWKTTLTGKPHGLASAISE
jgi:hypothetical protein